MPALQFFHPASVDEAIALLAASPPPVDSPTQRRIRGDEHLRHTFSTGRRRPTWVWCVRYDDDPTPLGVVAAFGSDAPDKRIFVLDHFGLPADPAAARALVIHATAQAVESGAEEAVIFAPTDTSLADDSLEHVARALGEAGWKLLVERRHYEFAPPAGLGDGVPIGLFLEQPTGPDDPRLAACHREIMRESLDAHDAARIDQVGFEAACRQSLADLLDADPVACIRLPPARPGRPAGRGSGAWHPPATDAAGPLVGLVSGRLMPSGRAFVLFVGVCRDHR